MIQLYHHTNAGILYRGHVQDILKILETESVHCIVTSPPYWRLRDYGLDPVIWDDPGDCEHVWGINLIRKSGGNKHSKSSQINGSGSRQAQEEIHNSSNIT